MLPDAAEFLLIALVFAFEAFFSKTDLSVSTDCFAVYCNTPPALVLELLVVVVETFTFALD